MPAEHLSPRLDLLTQEYVLVQAWKKSVGYIRAHNWYTDTLELDRTTVDLRRFLRELARRLERPFEWTNEPLRIVPAPKSQRWRVTKKRFWKPIDTKLSAKLRPLAHVGFMDQVVATALMLCLADRVETIQGDPRNSISAADKRRRVLSYGNRLFCDAVGQVLRHRWGSAKLYRAYFKDYQTFIARAEMVSRESLRPGRTIVVHSDLKQFYDRVTPSLVSQKVAGIQAPGDDPEFYRFAARLLQWRWDTRDSSAVQEIGDAAGLNDFSSVALPQGLVASGFFANVVLLQFDHAVGNKFGSEIFEGAVLEDICRYVDDIRLVLTIRDSATLEQVQANTRAWLQSMLDEHCGGLIVSPEKTSAATLRGDERPLVKQSQKMLRIQQAISGGFDATGGEDILGAIQGLIRSQRRYRDADSSGWRFAPVPDVRDPTVARFAAARYRSTFRSLRPLLDAHADTENVDLDADDQELMSSAAQHAHPRTQSELDDDARAFALGLIDSWIEDPSNVRLLRIGLDLWPAEDVLRDVLSLLRPFTEKPLKRTASGRVAWYCLSEIFRAGATETGFVEDNECLPAGIDILAYRILLLAEAHRLLALPVTTLPWYLRQQALLFVAVSARPPLEAASGVSQENRHYDDLLSYLRGETKELAASDVAILAILARRCYRDADTALALLDDGLARRCLEEIAARDPSFADEIVAARLNVTDGLAAQVSDNLSLRKPVKQGYVLLSDLVLRSDANCKLRDELSLLSFAASALGALSDMADEVVTPNSVSLKYRAIGGGSCEVQEVTITAAGLPNDGSLFSPPAWCLPGERWRFQLGYLLRFVLTSASDVLRQIPTRSWRECQPVYRAPESHWYQRVHGSFNAMASFGQDWLPLSSWTELLLTALLAWPGVTSSKLTATVQAGPSMLQSAIQSQHAKTLANRGKSTGLLVIPVTASWLTPSTEARPLRGCVVQTVFPEIGDFNGDPTLSGADLRKRHRNHLSASLSAVDKMLELRATHHIQKDRIDWLILPELAVHPRDVRTHLVPFARAHKTVILAGLAYERLTSGGPLVNSALWIIPQRNQAGGVDVIIRRQGKQHLAALELEFNKTGATVSPFRPCQWVVEYEWSSEEVEPLCLTAAICYDATDLNLVADLREQSDVFAIPALNQDIATFDQMALALHYHMFQLVVVANNGRYGGSNAYAPYRDAYTKQVFHLHGQPQASIAFFEIGDIAEFIDRRRAAHGDKATADKGQLPTWKYPPAGL